MEEQLLSAQGGLLTYSYMEMVLNMALAMVLGFAVSAVYRYTHKGLSYSQSFTHTILFVTIVVAIVMMVIGGSLARAFALVGALSIIRFRTVIKDTKDTAFVFLALAVGMAAGTSNYFLAVAGMLFMSAVAILVFKFNYGALYKSEFILRFNFAQDGDSSEYLEKINEFAKRSNMLHIEPSGDGSLLNLTFDIILRPDIKAEEFTRAITQASGVSEVVLIASKNDVDY
jgi:hypothetical protein